MPIPKSWQIDWLSAILFSEFLYSSIAAEEGVDAALAFVEAGPAGGVFVFAVRCGAWARLAADGTVTRAVRAFTGWSPEEILQSLWDDLQIDSSCGTGLSGPYASKICVFPSIWLGWVFVRICSKATGDHKRTYSLFGVSVTKRMSLLNYQFFIRIDS